MVVTAAIQLSAWNRIFKKSADENKVAIVNCRIDQCHDEQHQHVWNGSNFIALSHASFVEALDVSARRRVRQRETVSRKARTK